jgi:hypothetical protein
VRLRAKRAARSHPSQRRRTRHFGDQLVAHRAQTHDPLLGGHAGVVGERHVDATRCELGGHLRDEARWHARDQPDCALVGVDVLELVHAEDLGGYRGDLVGGHHP